MKNMRRWTWVIIGIALVMIAALFVLQGAQVSAHESREVGEYELVFGWQVEPAYAGVYNGPEVFISEVGTETPVEGAEQTLALTVTFGSKSKQLTLEPAWNDPGHYVAYLTPTRPGDYVFELTGTISTTGAITPTTVSETFTSADGEFSTIEPPSDVLFPDTTWDIASLQRQIDTLKTDVAALEEALAELQEGAE